MDKRYIKYSKPLVYTRNRRKQKKEIKRDSILKNGRKKEKKCKIKGKSGKNKAKKEGFYLTLENNDSSR